MSVSQQTDPGAVQSAELVIPCQELTETLPFFQEKLGFRLDQIFPADDPAVAVISGHGLNLRLVRGGAGDPGILRLKCDHPDRFANGEKFLKAPNGTVIEIVEANPKMVMPTVAQSFHVGRLSDSASWIVGRAGMQYRDLIPDRLGGSIIASHIRIPEGGPVPDMVHYHTIGFQLIYCYRGWVKLVYEDQGEPFIMEAGECVLQPPEIRHRVLEASDGLEVVEIGCPAEHLTTIDHTMELPNNELNPNREFGGQKFVWNRRKDFSWHPHHLDGFEARDSGIGEATKGVASVKVLRPSGGTSSVKTAHNADILFNFVLAGALTLTGGTEAPHSLTPGDAWVIPPDMPTTLSDWSDELELLEVSLPAS